jgi:Fe-S-cluster containining protein
MLELNPDCMTCGVCCSNKQDPKWIEVTEQDAVLKIDLTLLQQGDIETYAMRQCNGRCVTLRGNLGERCLCAIYPTRPSICREVQPGSEICLASIARFNIESSEEISSPGKNPESHDDPNG